MPPRGTNEIVYQNRYRTYLDVSTKKLPGRILIIDNADLPKVLDGKGKWGAVRRKTGIIYAARNRGKTELVHRVLLGVTDRSELVDHKNHEGLDCCRNNIRRANNSQNMRNMRANKGTTSRFLGVSWSAKEHKWVVYRQVEFAHKRIGCFDNEVDAAIAYDHAARSDPFANLNFPHA